MLYKQFYVKKEKKTIKVKKKGLNRTRTCSVHTKVKSSTIEPHSKLWSIGKIKVLNNQ